MNGAGIVHKLTQKTTGAHTYTIAVQLSAVRGVLRVILIGLIITFPLQINIEKLLSSFVFSRVV